MSPITHQRGSGDRVPNSHAAAQRAREALADVGCRSIAVDTPHQTIRTWIVPGTCDEGTVRVHIDARTGATRIVVVDHQS